MRIIECCPDFFLPGSLRGIISYLLDTGCVYVPESKSGSQPRFILFYCISFIHSSSYPTRGT